MSEFHWNSKVRGAILSALSYGFIITQLFGGILNTKLGGVRPMGYGILLMAIFTVLTPVVARYSVNLVFIIRVVEGVFQVCRRLHPIVRITVIDKTVPERIKFR